MTSTGVVVDARTLLVEDRAGDLLRGVVDQALTQVRLVERFEALGLDPQEAGRLLAGREPVTVVTPDGTEDEQGAGEGLAFLATVLLFLTLQINGGTLLTGTVEEKSSRVVEVLLGSLRPWQLLAGKLTGISVLAIGQLVAYVVALLGANAAVDAFEVPAATPSAVGTGLLFFLVGFGLYAALFTVAGSLATSLEDAQSSAGPLGFLTAGIYFGVLLGVTPNPDGLLAQVLTFVPPSAPFVVPARAALDAIAPWEIALSALLTVVATAMTVRLAGRLYSAALLAGGKLTWRGVWHAEPIA